VLVAWGLNAALVSWRRDGVDPVPTTQGLFAWDGAYYRDLAELGYHHVAPDSIRFHPLLPLLGWNGWGILVVAWVSALVAGAVVHRLVLDVVGDADAARRAATLVGLASPAFCLVWAYAEGPFLALAAAQLLALRWRRWWLAGALGAVAALARPAGLLLAIPAALEVLLPNLPQIRAQNGRDLAAGSEPPANLPQIRAQNGHDLAAGSEPPANLPLIRAQNGRDLAAGSGWVGRGVAIAGPVVGTLAFLLWARGLTGDWLAPVHVQDRLRGGFVFPLWRLVQAVGELVTDPLGDGLHTPFAIGMVALVWVCWRKLPLSWAALATVSVLVNLAADNLNSIERYAYGTVPLLVALAVVAGGRWWRPTIVISSAGFVAMTTLAWYGTLVP
jgi:hypothetical protein